MVDKSDFPCKHCGHRQNDHGKHFGTCYACMDNHKSGQHKFARLDNLEFLEWLSRQKESIDE